MIKSNTENKIAKVSFLALGKTIELFRFKQDEFKIDPFPGYSDDQWGIKAHNRPWVISRMKMSKGLRALEVGGAYSTLPKMLADKHGIEAWIGDDFGASINDVTMWTRWGNPQELPIKNKPVIYVFEPFGAFSEKYPSNYFDYIFSVSTLEHIPMQSMPDVFRDMHRCLRIGGKQIHTIDITTDLTLREVIFSRALQKYSKLFKYFPFKQKNPIKPWLDAMQLAGFDIEANEPNVTQLLSRQTLVESPDVVYRFYPPNNKSKAYKPAATLLVEIDKIQ